MSADTWTLHIVETFLNVVRRPRFGLKVGQVEENHPKRGLESLRVIIDSNGDKVLLVIQWNPKSVTMHASSADDPLGGFTSGFKFKANFERSKTPKVRKTALLFVKKLHDKPVYDVMKT